MQMRRENRRFNAEGGSGSKAKFRNGDNKADKEVFSVEVLENGSDSSDSGYVPGNEFNCPEQYRKSLERLQMLAGNDDDGCEDEFEDTEDLQTGIIIDL